MSALLRLYADIAFMRRGPEDLPASQSVLVLTALGYFVVNYLLESLLPQNDGPWGAAIACDVAFTLAWYWILLRLAGKPERFLQTASAVFGYQAVIAPVWISCLWLVARFRSEPLQLFVVSLLCLALFVWILGINVRILRSALGCSTAACVGLIATQNVASLLLVTSLFPPAPGAAAAVT